MKRMPQTPMLLIAIAIAIFSCDSKPKAKVQERNAPKVAARMSPYSNPVLIYGSSFGSFFQKLYRQGQYKSMLRFTSSSSIQRFGKDKISQFYKRSFHFDYLLGPLGNSSSNGDTIYLVYDNASILATQRKIIIPCLIENDSTKVVLYSLTDNIFNDGYNFSFR